MNRFLVICCCLGAVLADFPYPAAIPLDELIETVTINEELKPYPAAIPIQHSVSSVPEEELKPYPALISEKYEDSKPYPAAIPLKEQTEEDSKPYSAAIPVQDYAALTEQLNEIPKIDLPAVSRLPPHNFPKIQLPAVKPLVSSFPSIAYGVPSVEYASPIKIYEPPKEQFYPSVQVFGPPKVDLPAIVKLPSHDLPSATSYPYPAASPVEKDEESKPYPPPTPVEAYGPPKEEINEISKINVPAVIRLPAYESPKIELPSITPVSSIPSVEYGVPVVEYTAPVKVYGPPQQIYGPPKVDSPAVIKLPSHDLPKIELPTTPILSPYPSAIPLEKDELPKPYPPPTPAQEYGPPKQESIEVAKIDLPAVSRLPAHNLPTIQLSSLISSSPSIEYGVPALEITSPIEVYGPPEHEVKPLEQVYGPPKIDLQAVIKLPAHDLPKIELPEKIEYPYPAAIPESGPPAKEYGPPAKEEIKIDVPAVTKLPSYNLPKISLPAYSPLASLYPALEPAKVVEYGLPIVNYAPAKVYGPPMEESYAPSRIEIPAVTKLPSHNLPKIELPSYTSTLNTYPAVLPSKEYGVPAKVYGPPVEIYESPKIDLPAVTKLPAHDLPKIQLPTVEYIRPIQAYVPPVETYGPPAETYGPPAETYGPPDTEEIKTPVEEYGPPKVDLPAVTKLPAHNLPIIPTPSQPIEEPKQEPAKEYGPPKEDFVPITLSASYPTTPIFPQPLFEYSEIIYGHPEINYVGPISSFPGYIYQSPSTSYTIENIEKFEAPEAPLGTPFAEYGPPRE
ncbi:proline-rich extensin-like protein EPR1 [Ctenocephalides felis]|uniref:proline-rich extensin-like protein EPR1 n=1 Tax=Ctenocephalides felis TaxID=7515 RepID=UPI000E6E1159|nr:proline-rich extensin-like protein EPR1 [Ctenocephalides felis]